MKHRRSSVGRTRLILILLCIVLAAAMLWCALSLILRVGTYSGRTVGKDPVQEQTPVEPVDLEPTVPENSYDPAGFYEEGGFKRYKSEDTLAPSAWTCRPISRRSTGSSSRQTAWSLP